jgi:hypothetical protein
LLEYILGAVSFPGARELAGQVPDARVVGGLPTFIDLEVDRSAPPGPLHDGPVPVRTFVESDGGEYVGELLIWVKDGYLSGLEFAWVTDEVPTSWPEPAKVRVEPDVDRGF